MSGEEHDPALGLAGDLGPAWLRAWVVVIALGIALIGILGRDEALTDPGILHEAPHTAPVRRLDEVRAARQPVLRWQPENPEGG